MLIPLGFAVGAFGTLVGAGGGFILVPILLFLHPNRDPAVITSTSLLVVAMNALSGASAYARQQRIDYRSGAWFALGTLPGAVLGVFAVDLFPRRAFDGMFAIVLGALAVYLLRRVGVASIREPVSGYGVVHRMLRDRQGNTYIYSFQLWKGVLLSLFIGFFSSLLGIGGGVIHVPVMATILHFPVHTAVATSQFVLLFMSGEATIVHILRGTLAAGSALQEALLLGVGVIPGAQFGAWLGGKLHGNVISRVLAVSLLVVSLRLGIQAIMG